MQVFFQLTGVNKSFSGKRVLEEVNLSIQEGEIHGLVGKNGAGKSTLVNIVTGLLTCDSGDIVFEGKHINSLTVLERQKLGIFIVPQHATIIPEFSVAENLFAGIWPKTKYGTIDWKGMHRQARKELTEYGVELETTAKVKDLSLIEQRKLNIVKALFSKAKLIILDEPTTALSEIERNGMFDFIISLRKLGTSFVFISHYTEEIINLSDKITALRDGKSFTGYSKGELDEKQLSKLITGENVELTRRHGTAKKRGNKQTLLESQDLYGEGMEGITFDVTKGEVLGLVGFPGSGAREVCRALAGLNPVSKGVLKLDGKAIKAPKSPSEAIEQGIVYTSFDRHSEGIVKNKTIQENISLSILKSKLKRAFGIIDEKFETRNAHNYFGSLNIKANSVRDHLRNLSGGNQQKVVIAKALSCDPKLLILDEPTIGIDVKSREEILGIINNLTANQGVAVLYFTNDFEELLRISDRIIIFNNRKVTNVIINSGLTTEQIIHLRDAERRAL